MNCRTFTQHLDEYLEGALAGAAHEAAGAHLQGCADCQRRLARMQALRAALRNLPVPAPRAEFFEQALAHAQRPVGAPRRRWRYVAGAALAASLALWLASSWSPGLTPVPAAKPANVTIALNEVRTVQLAFAAERDLEQATLTIALPSGVELQGFPGQREVRWRTNLARGANVLSLPLIAVASTTGSLVARLEHGDRVSELTVALHVKAPARTSSLRPTCTAESNCRPGFKEVTDVYI
jgi:hypothetical protein